MEYNNDNRGALFRNDNKKEDTHPDYSGTINVEGKDFYISAWVKEKEGKKYFSMSVKPKEPRVSQPTPVAAAVNTDGLPF